MKHCLKSAPCMILIALVTVLSAMPAAGASRITGLLGITFGMTMPELRAALKRNPCILKKDGEPFLELVPLKPYYRSWCNYRSDFASEVVIWIGVESGVEEIKEVFTGEATRTLADCRREFKRLKDRLTGVWGSVEMEGRDYAMWKDGHRAAILQLIPTVRAVALPFLKLEVVSR